MTNFTNPTREAFGEFVALDRYGPIAMLNLIRLREKANYEADYEGGRDITGKEAYREYGRTAAKIFKSVGGKQIWLGMPELMLIGPTDEKWDIAFIAQYPNSKAFIEMVKNPEYQAIVFHRTAAVEDSRLLRLKMMDPGAEFGRS